MRERVREDSVAVQLLLWMFLDYISAAERKERRTDRKGSEGEGSGAHSTNQGSYFGRGPGLALEFSRTELSLLAG